MNVLYSVKKEVKSNQLCAIIHKSWTESLLNALARKKLNKCQILLSNLPLFYPVFITPINNSKVTNDLKLF